MLTNYSKEIRDIPYYTLSYTHFIIIYYITHGYQAFWEEEVSQSL
jgi:hypothetical protein